MPQRDRYIQDDEIKKRRKFLRGQMTRGEYVLWQELRKQKLKCKFRRQVSIGRFIVDFYCHQLRLVVEVDGWFHDDDNQKLYDRERDHWLQSRGYTVLHLSNDQVLFERDKALAKIREDYLRLSHTQ